MRLGSYRFSPPWWGIAITLVGVIILCALGRWQIERAHQKERMLAAIAAAHAAGPQPMPITPSTIKAGKPPKYGYRYIVHGHYDPAHQILLTDQVEGTQNGYRVWTPLILASGARVMVDRGWIAKPEDAQAPLPAPTAPRHAVTVRGYWRSFPSPGLRLGDDHVCNRYGWPRALSYPTAATVRCQYRAPVANGLLLLNPKAPNGFVRDWDTDDIGLTPFAHYAYASQWFLMALVAFGIFVGVNLVRADP